MEQINQYLTFLMGNEHYALPVNHIREVLVVPKVTRIPRMPEYMSGVINLRGSVVPVLDLALKFGMEQTRITPDSAIIVAEIPVRGEDDKESCIPLGVFADSVEKVISIEPEKIEPPPRIGSKIDTAFIKGMGHVDDNFLVILDIREILTSDDLEIMEDVHESVAE